MGEKTAIAWTDHSFSPWWGCQKVSPACDNCYAERDAHRYYPQAQLWGPDSQRRYFSDKTWHNPLQWDARAARDGVRRRVFCASMADVFDNHPGVTPHRDRLWALIRHTPHLDWQLLTKRISNVPKMLPEDWGEGYPNVWLGVSVVTQTEVDRDVPRLIATPARVKFLSCEPLIEKISIFHYDEDAGALRGAGIKVSGGRSVGTPHDPPEGYDDSYPGIDQIIVGGESGPRARPMKEDWAMDLLDECELVGVAFFMKQLSQANWPSSFRDFQAFHPKLQVRQWPESMAPAQAPPPT